MLKEGVASITTNGEFESDTERLATQNAGNQRPVGK